MHVDAQPFMAQLGLTDDADERAVKRAYAIRLKKIDQETDPEGFQQLRETYDAALHWVKLEAARREAAIGTAEPDVAAQATTPTAQETGSPPTLIASEAQTPPPVPDDAAPSPEQLASAVFDAFLQTMLSCSRTLEDMSSALRAHLNDVRLVNLEARVVFEWLIGRQLAEGWRPGHEVLFVAATDCFQWEADRNRLNQFGRVGALLDTALSERAVFHSQPDEVQDHYREVIRELRRDEHPGLPFLRRHLEEAELLVSRLPNWLWIITRPERIEPWREWAKSLSPSRAPTAPPPLKLPPPLAQQKKQNVSWWAVLLVVMALGKLVNLASSPSSTPSSLSDYQMPVATQEAWPPRIESAQPNGINIDMDPYRMHAIPVSPMNEQEAGNEHRGPQGSQLYKGMADITIDPSEVTRPAKPAYTPPPDPIPTRPAPIDKAITNFDPGKLDFEVPFPAPSTGPPAHQPLPNEQVDGPL